MSDIGFNISPSFVPTPQAAPADAKTGATGPITPQSATPSDGKAMAEVRKGSIPATGDRLSLTVSPTARGGDILPPDTALLNAIEKMILQVPSRILASSIGLSLSLAAAVEAASGIAHHGEPDESLDEPADLEPQEDDGSPQMPRLRRAGMRLSKHSQDEEGALAAF